MVGVKALGKSPFVGARPDAAKILANGFSHPTFVWALHPRPTDVAHHATMPTIGSLVQAYAKISRAYCIGALADDLFSKRVERPSVAG